jgi:pilus assembly protein Flp/PilA
MTQRASAAHSLPGHLSGDRGASAVEYGLVLAAVTVVIVGLVFFFGTFVKQTFEESSACLANQGVGEPFPDC